jgi:16S rRNA (adenine1518-N6/adenine1519-N6)-dimethyltransferase
LVFQKEFANRLVASVGDRDYGWLTVLTYYYAEVELLDAVPKPMFYPQPKVDSVITRLTPKKSQPFMSVNNVAFKRLLQSLFTQRNKKIRNAVLPYLKVVRGMPKEDAVKTTEKLPFCDKRVRELAPEDFGALANALNE